VLVENEVNKLKQGVYSVPGWGNSGSREGYVEWYWYHMNQGPDTWDQTYQYNLATYGPNHNYDDFIQNFTASAFNPKDWVISSLRFTLGFLKLISWAGGIRRLNGRKGTVSGAGMGTEGMLEMLMLAWVECWGLCSCGGLS
jgi:hypothetical protein